MLLFLIVSSSLLIILSVTPFIQHQHRVFRVTEFIKLQLLPLQIVIFTAVYFYVNTHPALWYLQAVQCALILYHIYILMRYTKFWRTTKFNPTEKKSAVIKILSCNVYQYNTEYNRFLDLVRKEKPDLVLTMESDTNWEHALRALEHDYPHFEKVTLENTYDMHFYTKLKVNKIQTHYFVADNIPSIEAELETSDGYRFIFFGVHPPPPGPTEEENSKERDGDLLSVAKRVRDYKLPVVVTGDFNNVAWARSSILFKKTSRLIDARIGRGILSTFHAKYWFFRVPLDLLFHSPEIFIDRLFVAPSIGSDHFPIGCTFHIDKQSDEQEKEVKKLDNKEMQEVNELIEEGKQEESDNR